MLFASDIKKIQKDLVTLVARVRALPKDLKFLSDPELKDFSDRIADYDALILSIKNGGWFGKDKKTIESILKTKNMIQAINKELDKANL